MKTWPIVAFGLVGCITNSNAINPTSAPASAFTAGSPALPITPSAQTPADSGGPRIVWYDGHWYLRGLRDVPGRGAQFSVLESPRGRNIGVVSVSEPASNAEGWHEVAWFCWARLSPRATVRDSLPVEQAAAGVGGKCSARFTTLGPWPENTPASANDRVLVTLDLGTSNGVVVGDRYRLLSAQGDFIGGCRVYDADFERSRCEVTRGDSKLFFDGQVERGYAHVIEQAPTEREIEGWIRSYAAPSPVASPPPPSPLKPVSESPTGPNGSSEHPGLGTNTWLAISAFGAGALSLGASLVIYSNAKSDYDAALRQCKNGICPDPAADEVDSARTRGWVATGCFGAGLALAGAGTYLLVKQPFDAGRTARSSPARLLRVGMSGNGLTVRGSF